MLYSLCTGSLSGTFWAFVPAIVAIVLALITKQVYVSLFFGIFVGAMFYSDGNPLVALQTLFEVMSAKLGDNAPILVFLVILGIFVVLMQKSGGSKAYGNWAQKHIRSRKGAMAATAGLGCLIFVDDYFNCLTVGSVMRPVTDKFKISHSKLAYLIDATAAPICIIAPISSWAAAVSGQLEGNGILLFIKTIPFNLYALLTIVTVFCICAFNFDFGKMKKHETMAQNGDLDGGANANGSVEEMQIVSNPKGKVRHLIVPVIILIVCCIFGMLYTGGLFDGADVVTAFSDCDSGMALAMGSTIALVIVSIYYMIEKVVSFTEITDSFTQGFKTMVGAILILTFAWTLSGIMGAKGGYLDAQAFVNNNLSSLPASLKALFPTIFFVLACAIAFATGTSWGTFSILVPISVTILGGASTLTILTISATLGGAVFGDHVSPISDTTILASAGAGCNHVDHVSTQMPYAGVVAIVCTLSYIVAGLCALNLNYGVSVVITLGVGLVLMAGVLVFLTKKFKNTDTVTETENEKN